MRLQLLSEILKYMRIRKKWWLLPVFILLLGAAVLIVVAETSVISTFIYALF